MKIDIVHLGELRVVCTFYQVFSYVFELKSLHIPIDFSMTSIRYVDGHSSTSTDNRALSKPRIILRCVSAQHPVETFLLSNIELLISSSLRKYLCAFRRIILCIIKNKPTLSEAREHQTMPFFPLLYTVFWMHFRRYILLDHCNTLTVFRAINIQS